MKAELINLLAATGDTETLVKEIREAYHSDDWESISAEIDWDVITDGEEIKSLLEDITEINDGYGEASTKLDEATQQIENVNTKLYVIGQTKSYRKLGYRSYKAFVEGEVSVSYSQVRRYNTATKVMLEMIDQEVDDEIKLAIASLLESAARELSRLAKNTEERMEIFKLARELRGEKEIRAQDIVAAAKQYRNDEAVDWLEEASPQTHKLYQTAKIDKSSAVAIAEHLRETKNGRVQETVLHHGVSDPDIIPILDKMRPESNTLSELHRTGYLQSVGEDGQEIVEHLSTLTAAQLKSHLGRASLEHTMRAVEAKSSEADAQIQKDGLTIVRSAETLVHLKGGTVGYIPTTTGLTLKDLKNILEGREHMQVLGVFFVSGDPSLEVDEGKEPVPASKMNGRIPGRILNALKEIASGRTDS